MRSLFIQKKNFNETLHKYSSGKWELKVKRFSRSEVKGQGDMCYVYICVNATMAEAYISTVWRRGLFVFIIVSVLLLCILAQHSDSLISLWLLHSIII